jgi:hypothetical protein
VQTALELYRSREMRFTDRNKYFWMNAIGVQDGQNILEVGCAGGVLCHKLKQYLPNIKITVAEHIPHGPFFGEQYHVLKRTAALKFKGRF